MLAKPNRRWYQFSLRTLVVVTTIAGFGLGYVGYERRLAQHQQQIEAELNDHRIRLSGGRNASHRPGWLKQILGDDSAGCAAWVHVYADPFPSSTESRERAIDKLNQLPEAASLSFADKQIDDERLGHFRRLTNIRDVNLEQSRVTENGLRHLRGYKNLKGLNLLGTNIGDTGLKEIARHQDLEWLIIGYTNVTDAGLRELRPLIKLKWLYLGKTSVTDAGLKELRGYQSLEMLEIGNTSVSDAGLRELRPLNKLSHLDLRGTKVTDAGLQEIQRLPALKSIYLGASVTLPGIQKLKKAMPNLIVSHDS